MPRRTGASWFLDESTGGGVSKPKVGQTDRLSSCAEAKQCPGGKRHAPFRDYRPRRLGVEIGHHNGCRRENPRGLRTA